jgi:hypothetical protein
MGSTSRSSGWKEAAITRLWGTLAARSQGWGTGNASMLGFACPAGLCEGYIRPEGHRSVDWLDDFDVAGCF